MLNLGLVAIDGTKVKAAVSGYGAKTKGESAGVGDLLTKHSGGRIRLSYNCQVAVGEKEGVIVIREGEITK